MYCRGPRCVWSTGSQAARRDPRKAPRHGGSPVLAVHVEELGDRGLVAWTGGLRRPYPREARRERIADTGDPLGSESRHACEAPVVRRRFQILESHDAEVVIEPVGERPADAGDRSEDRRRIAFAAQPFEDGEPARADGGEDRPRENRPDPRQTIEPAEPFRGEDLRDGPSELAQRTRAAAIRLHTEGIRSLPLEQGGDFLEPSGDFPILLDHLRRSPWRDRTGAYFRAHT